MQTFDIYFSGELLADTPPERARSAIGRMFRVEGAALERLFSGQPVRVKSGVDVDKAGRYRQAFREAGALVDIVPEGSPPPGRSPAPPAEVPPADSVEEPDDEGMQLLPPRTGTLEDCAPRIEAQEIPDTGWMDLDAPGITLDETPPPPAAEIDTDRISNSGLDAPGTILDETPAAPPAEIDTDGLSMSEAQGFTLEDCVDSREPDPLPDTSHLALEEETAEDPPTGRAAFSLPE
jgi:hypothetical protein